jgi:hypothetical protein
MMGSFYKIGRMPVDEKDRLDNEKVVDLLMTQSEPEANLIKGILEAAGIDCALVTQVPHNVYPFTVDGLAAIQIKVLTSQREAALTVLRDHLSQSGPDEETIDEDP